MDQRHFTNPYPDYDAASGWAVDEDTESFIKGLIQKNVKLILEQTNPIDRKKSRPDVYVGLSGIAYMFLRLAQTPFADEFKALEKAKMYASAASEISQSSRSKQPLGLLSGDAGVQIVSAAVKKAVEEPFEGEVKKLRAAVPIFQNPEYLDDGADEMLVGRCGFLLGILWLNKQVPSGVFTVEEVQSLAHYIIESGREYSRRYRLDIPLMYQYHSREYLGAAHGISAILQSLLMVPLEDKNREFVKRAVDGVLELQDGSGNFPSKFNKAESDLVHWCHGSPGVIYLMAKAFKTFGDQKYLDSCLKSGDLVWKLGLLMKGPGICHGVAGNGFVHLLLYRLTKDQKHLYRAVKFAEFLEDKDFVKESRAPDRPYSLFEGIAGTVCFLIDILAPETAEFPFMNIFE